MPLKIYRGGTLTEEGEREQLSHLLEIISANFDDRLKNNYLVIDPKFPKGGAQIDSLFYRDGQIVILELKNIKGKFKPTKEGPWKLINADQTEKEIGNQHKNPFFQVYQQRKFLIGYICSNIRKESVSKDKGLSKEIGDRIGGWIVTAEGSEPTLTKHPDYYWSKVIPLDKIITELSFIGTSNVGAITENEFTELLKQTESVETNKNDVFLTGVVPKYENGRSPVVENMIDSGKPDEISKSIKYCRELSFIDYFDKYKMIIPALPQRVREEVYSLLFEWLIEFPQKFDWADAQQISESGIRDEYYQIRWLTLNFLSTSKYGIGDELAYTLVGELQNEKYFSNIQLFIEVLSQIDNRGEASRALKAYYDDHLRENFFYWEEQFRILNQPYHSNVYVPFDKDKQEQYKNAQKQASSYSKVVKTWLEAASEINTDELKGICLFHLRQVISRLQFDPNDELDLPARLYETIISLGTMKYLEATEDLLEILYKFKSIDIKLRVIEALGKIGNAKVIPELRKFWSESGNYDPVDAKRLKGGVSMALARLEDSEYFDRIWNEFVVAMENFHEFWGKPYLNNLFESLKTLNVKKLEQKLWNEVEKRNYSQKSFRIFTDFITDCASSYTFEKCKELVLDPKFWSCDSYYCPGGILTYSVWKYDNLKEKGQKLGLKLLKMKDVKLQEIGLSLAELYFMKNPDKLSDYENIESEEGQYALCEMYVKLKKRDKIELLYRKYKEDAHRHLFYCLERMIPEMHFEYYSIVKNHKVLHSEFIAGDLGIYIQTKESKEGVVYKRDYPFIPWDRISYMKRLKFNKITIGLIIGCEDCNLSITLIPDSAMERDYLNGYRTEEFPGLNKLLEKFEKTKDVSKKGEVCFESSNLFKDIEAVFVTLHTLNGMSKDANLIRDDFEKEFKPEIVSIV